MRTTSFRNISNKGFGLIRLGNIVWIAPAAIPATYFMLHRAKEETIREIFDAKVHSFIGHPSANPDQCKMKVLLWNLCCLDGINPVTKFPHDIFTFLAFGGSLCFFIYLKIRMKFKTEFISKSCGPAIWFGVALNQYDMHITENFTSELLRKQWGIRSLDHERTLNLLHVILSRNIRTFEPELRAISWYVNLMTGEDTYWDVPSTYIWYSPVVIMQFLFNEMEMKIGTIPLPEQISQFFFKCSVQDISNGFRLQPLPYLTPDDAKLREFLVAIRNSRK